MKIDFGVSGVYKITNIINGKIYIGSTKCIRRRFVYHKNLLVRNKHGNRYLQDSWNEYGENAFDFSILEIVKNKDDRVAREQFWIDHTKCFERSIGFNIYKIATSSNGFIRTEDHKRKISLANKGRVVSDKARENMRKGHLGYKQSEEHISKRIKTMVENGSKRGENHHFYGKKITNEHKSKIKKSHTGKHVGSDNNQAKLTEDDVRQIKILLKEGKLLQSEIAEMFNVGKQNISSINCEKIWTHISIE